MNLNSEVNKIPVLIITGFLGAGKTTFINRLIHMHKHLKLALVENEFGEVSIDHDLIVGMRTEKVYDLSNGCICCSIFDEFSLTLIELANSSDNIDFLLIETTGVADLSRVIRPFYAEGQLKEHFSLQGSICLIDALNFDEQLKGTEQQMQVILSDLLLVNKTEGVDPKVLPGIDRRLTVYNSSAKIIHTSFSELADFSLETFEEKVHGQLEQKLSGNFMFRVTESKRYTTFTHRFYGPVNLDRFQYWFNYFVAINQLDVYRVKGILFPEGQPDKVIVQAVGGAVSYTEGSIITPGEEPINTIVFIGKSIDADRIADELERYLHEQE